MKKSNLSNLSDIIPAIYICTVENSKRIPNMKAFLKRLNVDESKTHWNIVPRMHKKTQQLSSTDNHLLAFKDALKRGYDYILVFEDDIYISPDTIIEEMVIALNTYLYFWNHTQNKTIIYLGQLAWNMPLFPKKNTVVKSMGQCIHAYIVNRNFMKDIVAYSCHDVINISKKYWFSRVAGYALDTFITIKVRDKTYESLAIYPQMFMQDSIKNYEDWSNAYEELCCYLGTFKNIYIILPVLVYLFIKEKNQWLKYVYFGCITICVNYIYRMRYIR